MENWANLPFAADYEVSDLGRIRRRTKSKPRHSGYCHPVGKFRKPWRKSDGKYLLVTLFIDGKSRGYLVHRLVMLAFRGPSDLPVNHRNGKHDDNRLHNLEYVTARENQIHSRDVLGTMPKGERHHNAKLTEPVVRQILQAIAGGEPDARIAERVGCTPTNIYYIRKGKAWAHVSRPTPSKSA